VGIVLALVIVVISLTPQFRSLATFPNSVRIVEGTTRELSLELPVKLYVRKPDGAALRLNGSELVDGTWEAFTSPLAIEPLAVGTYRLQLRLFGFIPFRTLHVDVLPSIEVFPGGQSIGVVLHSEGVLVIDHSAVVTSAGDNYSPAKAAGVRVGDLILKIGDTTVQNKEHVGKLVNEEARRDGVVDLTINRDGKLITREVKPLYDVREKAYLLGLWIKDGAAGVGTLTYYEPETRRFGALGHVIADGRTQKPIQVQSGRIVLAQIAGIDPGKPGQPGEKFSHFNENEVPLGIIQKNGQFGITGILERMPKHPLYSEPIPVALAKEVEEGPAEIVTVIKGRSMQTFSVVIERAVGQDSPGDKGLVVKVKDPDLLEATGGIVQGMSGSPILQGGKLVGAVTHVFVNDPTRGYGVYAEWMLQEAGVFVKDSPQATSVLP